MHRIIAIASAAVIALAVSIAPATAPAVEAQACTNVVSSGISKSKQPHTFQVTFSVPGGNLDNKGIIFTQAEELYNLRIIDTKLEGGQTVRGYYFGPLPNGQPQQYSLVDNYTVYFTLDRTNDRAYAAFKVYAEGTCQQTYQFAYWVK